MARKTHATREGWLRAAVGLLTPRLEEAGATMPEDWAVSVGWPRGKKAIGQCWPPETTDDEKTTHMFVSPKLGDPVVVLATLLHEMVHAGVGCSHGHRGPFRTIARAVGLEGKMTSTSAGEELMEHLRRLADRLGPYPHAAITRSPAAQRPPAGGWVKFVSRHAEDYILRVSPRALEEHGPPQDPWSDVMEEA